MTQAATNDDLIYVVDDDRSISKLVAINLTARGYQVKQFDKGNEILDRLNSDGPSLIIMDILMPGANGLEVTRKVRQVSTVPIMILSVRDETSSKLAALDLGADDYVTKPFRVEELLARVRAILRRSAWPADSSGAESQYQCGELSIDLECREVSSHEESVHLTQQEWAILKVLVNHAGSVVTPRHILQRAWGEEYGDEDDYVRTYITRLRKKLEREPRNPRFILLERGLGYRLIKGE
ncbi:MAG: hypothetical protein BZY80_05985 [SAR202 cluster bacterium Io17-Chloro-G2]|nr:MAG: hypothetical protein BZY80_05985 [SAR202 cluster bacterium Io17-Chloro-G2]